MTLPRAGIAAALMLSLAGTTRAGTITVFTDIDEWRLAASGAGTGVITELDFETLPDGSPTPTHEVFITPEFNYMDLGVTFSAALPYLYVRDYDNFPAALIASHFGESGPNSIIAEVQGLASAVGINFPGHTTLFAYDKEGALLHEVSRGGGGDGLFLGLVSELAIATVIVDRGGISGETIESFMFTPVPEPGSLLLLGAGAITLLARKRR